MSSNPFSFASLRDKSLVGIIMNSGGMRIRLAKRTAGRPRLARVPGGGGGGGGSGDLPSSEPARRTGDDGNNGRAGNVTPEQIMQRQRDELSKRYTLFKRMKQNMGHTALMLSGGGAQAMYHLGTIKALVESALYEHIHVISGTSGGR